MWIVLILLIIGYLTYRLGSDPIRHIPGPFVARFVPCMISIWAITGRLSSRIISVLKDSTGNFIRVGIRRIGVLNRETALIFLHDRDFLKIPPGSGTAMVERGLPFKSDPIEAARLRKASLDTVLGARSCSLVTKEAIWEVCLNPFLTSLKSRILDPEHLISKFVQTVVFLFVLELPPDHGLELPQIETGAAAINRMIAGLTGDSWLARTFLKIYKALGFIPGVEPDTEGTRRFIEHVIEFEPSLVQRMRLDGFDEKEIACHLTTIFQAGTDTTSFALKVGLILLARNPEVTQNLYYKIRDLPEEWDYTTLISSVPEITSFVYATLNYLTPIPILRSRVCSEDKIIENVKIPAGTIVAFPNDFLMTSNGKRVFSMESAKEKNLSFGMGHRMCLGRHLAEIEMAMLFSAVIRNYQIRDCHPEIDLEENCRSLVTRYWLRKHDLEFIPR